MVSRKGPSPRSKDKQPDLEYIFYPHTIAVVGASNDPTNYFGYIYMTALSHFGPNLYPVNPRQAEIHGFKAYRTLSEIQGPVDHVICSIPAAQLSGLVEECGAKGTRILQIASAGFSETGDEEGMRLEMELVQTAAKFNLRLIGPNCMGIYCPPTGLSFNPAFSKEEGCVGYLSQSGGNTTYLINLGTFRGIRFSKVINYGNGCDLDESDFLEYFAQDPKTRIIAAYIEGTKDGQRFLKVLGEAARVKPVIVCKGGRTEAGARAVAGHTGALAGSNEIWKAAFRQKGVIQVDSMEEMTDVILAFLLLHPPRGRNIGIVGVGGGVSVQAADECESAGLTVPPLPAEIRQELMKFTPPAGSSVRNPVDTTVARSLPQYARTLELVAGCDKIDLLIVFHPLDFSIGFPPRDEQEEIGFRITEALATAAKVTDKPTVVCIVSSGIPQLSGVLYGLHEQCVEAGFPVYPTLRRAAQTISRFISYHEKRVGL